MAWLFAKAFGTSPEFWLNLQTNYDLVRFRPKRQAARIAIAVLKSGFFVVKLLNNSPYAISA
jgi:plasmid maintenance system antidote protein VapI